MPRVDLVCSVVETFEASIRSLWPADAPRRAAVAVSGGADSVALLSLCAGSELFEKVVCAHFDHALRGAESDEDERFVRGLAHDRGLAFRSERWRQTEKKNLSRPDRNLQAAARKARYRFLAQVAREEGCDTILTAHHARDQVETILLNLARGGGSGAWEGIRSEIEMNGVRVARPLLRLSPDRIRDYLRAHGENFREDSSNPNPKYKRNWMRLELLPKVSAALPAYEGELLERWSAYQLEVERWKRYGREMRARGLERGGELLILREDLAQVPPESRFLCLQELLRELDRDRAETGWSPTRRKPIEKLFAMLEEGGEGETDLPGQIRAQVTVRTIRFIRPQDSRR